MISLIDDFQNDFQFFALVERRRIFKFPPPLLLATIKMTTVLKTEFFAIAYFGSQYYCDRGETRVSDGRRRDRRPLSRAVRPAPGRGTQRPLVCVAGGDAAAGRAAARAALPAREHARPPGTRRRTRADREAPRDFPLGVPEPARRRQGRGYVDSPQPSSPHLPPLAVHVRRDRVAGFLGGVSDLPNYFFLLY